MEKFSDFISEQKNDEPYRVLIISHDDPDDPPLTSERFKKKCDELGIECYVFELAGGYLLDGKAYNKDDKNGFPINPNDTLVLVRGSVINKHSWLDLVTQLERAKYCVVNSRHCLEVCYDKYRTSMFLNDVGLRQPKSVILSDEESIGITLKRLKSKFPIILKTITGTHGVGVMFIESERALNSIVQILYKLDEDIGIILQEYIKTNYDIRVHVLNKEVVATLKRPVIKGDFRSNVSQGSKPTTYELTEKEKQDCISAAKSVDGIWVGVDFIPATNPEKEQPFIIEVNGSPGTSEIDKVNKMDMSEMILNHFKNRDNWLKPKPFRSIYGENNE